MAVRMPPRKTFQGLLRHWKRKSRRRITMTPIQRASPRPRHPSPAAVDGSVAVSRPIKNPALHLQPTVGVLPAQISQPTEPKVHGRLASKMLAPMLAKEVWRLVIVPACERRKWPILKTILIVGLRELLAGRRGRKENGVLVMRSTWG